MRADGKTYGPSRLLPMMKPFQNMQAANQAHEAMRRRGAAYTFKMDRPKDLVSAMKSLNTQWAITHVVMEDGTIREVIPISVDAMYESNENFLKNIVNVSIGYKIEPPKEDTE